MPIRWKIFRILCILQMIAAVFSLLRSLLNFFTVFSFGNCMAVLLYLLILLLTILAVNLVTNNYPTTPVEGKQKKSFNRLFLLNFLFLTFLFGFVIAEFRIVGSIAVLLGRPIIKLPFRMYSWFLLDCFILFAQLLILYGLYVLRSELYYNFRKEKFEFETTG